MKKESYLIPVNPQIDIMLDRYFSKRRIKTHKLVDPDKLFTKIIAEAQYHHEQFMPQKAKSYKAGFDNGYGLGYYAGLIKAAKICQGKKR
jgi:hypothetical protein